MISIITSFTFITSITVSPIEKEIKVKPSEEAPAIQKLYREYCHEMNHDYIQDAYIHNSKKLDTLMGELLQEASREELQQNTVILFTSVNGNLLGEHGLWGCCYNGFNECVHIPCLLSLPKNLSSHQQLAKGVDSMMTSSIDLLPTLLHIAGIDQEEVQNQLRQSHKKIPLLVGTDLCEVSDTNMNECIYYQNEDVAMPLEKVVSSSISQQSIGTLLAIMNDKQYKLNYYSSDPRSCSYILSTDPNTFPCEWELFDLDNDPQEVIVV